MAAGRKKILGIVGSLRSNSVNEILLRYLANKYTQSPDIRLYNGIAGLPHFNLDLEDENLPVRVKIFRAQVGAADGIICTPEYVFSLPGVLKNAIKWAVPTTIFSDKPD